MLVIGIAGGSGSGKTAITREIKERFGDKVTVIGHDSYYYSQAALDDEKRKSVNYDHPDAFETELLCEHLDKLKKGECISVPVYNYAKHEREAEGTPTAPTDIVIVEGILIFEDSRLRSLFDVAIFVDTDADIRLVRRIRRDMKSRGRTLESILDQYEKTVKPMHDTFVEPSKKYADMIIPEGAQNKVAIDMLFAKIGEHLGK